LHQLGMISLTPGAAGDYRFTVVVQDTLTTTIKLAGTITPYGAIEVTDQAVWNGSTCPVCLAATTQIATPGGAVPITELAIGDLVWTRTATGERGAQPVRQLSRTAAPPTHRLIALTLADGRQVAASAGHPTSTGQPLGALTVGDVLDGAVIVTRREIPYGASWTYDLLPAGDTGVYWADGVLLGSTLHP
ncbi:MAG TPA: Hint domain-containing protein, partial [Herpetosiphonaceae bacterium]